MDQQSGNNFSQQPGRPMLKKVKRPINRIRPQSPAMTDQISTASSNITPQPNQNTSESSPSVDMRATNPFIQQSINKDNDQGQGFSEEVFNLDNFLDNNDTLPAVNKAPTNYREQPRFIEEEDLIEENEEVVAPYLNKKILVFAGILIFFLGAMLSRLITTDSKVVRNGLQGVVVNPEVPRGRPRCGVAERTQGCVLYIMNPQRQELAAREFYDLAAQLTGRQRFVIDTGNMRYSNTKIRPGDIAQLNIPPL